MKFNCPQCNYKCDFTEVKGDADLMAIIRLQQVFGKHASLVWAYAEQFGATIHKTRVKKLRLILEEMAGLFQTGAFKYQKKEYRISPAGIADALGVVAHKHFETRLENHNYLKKVMLDIAVKADAAQAKRDETDLRDREDQARHKGVHLTDAERQANLQKLRNITEGIG